MTGEPGHTEVRELYAIFVGDKDVSGLNVAMDHGSTMRNRESFRDMASPLTSSGEGGCALRDNLLEGLPFDQFHHQIGSLCGLFDADVMHGDDSRVREFADYPRLAEETIASVATSELRGEELDGYGTINEGIMAANDAAMGTDAESFVDLVAADLHG